MRKIQRPVPACLLTALLVTLLLVTGCQKQTEPAQSTIFAMDTVMNLTIYPPEKQDGTQALNSAVEQIYALEQEMSATREDSPIYALNHSGGQWVELPQLLPLLKDSLALCQQTRGALDLTTYPALEAWGFLSKNYRVPPPQELAELAEHIDYTMLERSDTGARLPEPMQLDLGAVAKGYAGDVLVPALKEQGVTSALLDLGQSTIVTIGTKPDGTPWRIGIQDPFGRQDYLGVLELADLAVGTSGGYQRFFEENGQTYWHIIDPDTAAPARSGLASVTVVSPSALTCDGLSTALFVMGLEEGTQFWRDHPELDFQALFITDEGEIYLTPGLEEQFSTAQEHSGKVKVLQ